MLAKTKKKPKKFKYIKSMSSSYKSLFRSTSRLVLSIQFWTLSTIGNLIVFTFSGLFYLIESEVNPKVNNYLDCIWWAFATVTTVGYGDITPVSPLGRLVGILLMLIGTALFACYIAMFADLFINTKVKQEANSQTTIIKKPSAR